MGINFFQINLSESCILAIFSCTEKTSDDLIALNEAINNYTNGKDFEEFSPAGLDAYTKIIVRNIVHLPYETYYNQMIPNNLESEDYLLLLKQFGITNVQITNTPIFPWDEKTQKINHITGKTKMVVTYNLQNMSLVEFLLENKDRSIVIMLQSGQMVKDNKIRGLVL